MGVRQLALWALVVRSLPEKTLEHWASMYITHRFPLGSLWWPTFGEDVRIEDLGTVPGKALLLELKVPEQQPNGTHVVTVDLPQLNKYLRRATPVYYAFPEPPWTGNLRASAWLAPERRADLAFRRTKHRWFGHWTVVCSATELHRILNPSPTALTATLPFPFPGGWPWVDFWRKYGACGSPAAPSLFIVSDTEEVPGEGPPQVLSRVDLSRRLLDLRSRNNELPSVLRQRARESVRDRPRYFYVPVEDGRETDRYRQVTAQELGEDLALAFGRELSQEADVVQALAICAVPFDGLDLA